MANLIGRETWSNTTPTTQVYKVTHDGAGKSLPYMERSFISFTFGGKAIEDFNLIVVNSGDRFERNGYASFADNTTTYDTQDGQIYWGSRYEANQLELTLATDSITEQQLDEFKEWFAAGKERELILSEHPNRAILARVSEPPSISMIPFEKDITLTINYSVYTTKTTEYKGEITLKFIMDEPFWYSKLTFMPYWVNKKTLEAVEANSSNSNAVESLRDKDMLKIMAEDGIPHQSNVRDTMFLGDNVLAVVSEARTDFTKVELTPLGVFIESTAGFNINANNGDFGFVFYSGTAPSYPIFQFSMLPVFSNNYISCPRNKIQNSNLTTYSEINIGEKAFRFTTPSLLTGYNQGIKIFKNALNKPIADVKSEIIDTVREKYSRAWAIACLNAIGTSGALTQANVNTLVTNMATFINPEYSMVFTVNSKTGSAIGRFQIKMLTSSASTVSNTTSYTTVEENVGDMVVSDYLILEGKDHLDANGNLTLANCKRISSNENLTNVYVLFNNMYL